MIPSLAKIFLQNVAIGDELQIWDNSWINSTLSTNIRCMYDYNLSGLPKSE